MEPWSWAGGTCNQEAQRMDAGGSKWRRESSGHGWESWAMVWGRRGGPERTESARGSRGAPEFKTSWFRGPMWGEGRRPILETNVDDVSSLAETEVKEGCPVCPPLKGKG